MGSSERGKWGHGHPVDLVILVVICVTGTLFVLLTVGITMQGGVFRPSLKCGQKVKTEVEI